VTNPQQPAIPPTEILCPHCGGKLAGMNVAGMKLPIPSPDGKAIAGYLNFLVPCCPHCNTGLAFQFTGKEDAPAPGAAAGLWTPPGSH
jgi:hypothetical protein